MYVCTREREREDAVIADFGSRRGFPLAMGEIRLEPLDRGFSRPQSSAIGLLGLPSKNEKLNGSSSQELKESRREDSKLERVKILRCKGNGVEVRS